MNYANKVKHKMCARPAHTYLSQRCQIDILIVIRKIAKGTEGGYLQVILLSCIHIDISKCKRRERNKWV